MKLIDQKFVPLYFEMMHLSGSRLLFGFLFMLYALQPVAQSAYIDSLQRVLSDPKLPDTSKMEVQINIGNALAGNFPQQASAIYQAVYTHADKSENLFYQGMAMSGLAKLFDMNNLDSAFYYYAKADSFFAQVPTIRGIESRATNKASIASIYSSQDQFEKAIAIYQEAIAIMERSNAYNKWLSLGILYANVGGVYHDLRQFDKSLEYDLKALDAYQKDNSDVTYDVIGQLYIAGDYKDLNRLPEAKRHIEEAQRLSVGLRSADLDYRVNNAWGSYYQQARDYQKSVTAYLKALTYATETKNIFRQMNCNRMLGVGYLELKEYPESIRYLQQALLHARTLQDKGIELLTMKNLAVAATLSGNAEKAVTHYEEYIRLSDSMNVQETRLAINEMENRYQAQKKQDSIATLQKSNDLQQSQLRQKATQNIALITVSILLLAVAVLSYINYRNKTRLYQQQKTLHIQKISELEKEKKLLAAQAMMKGQEDERSRLARDLHDGVGGLLSGVRLSMSTMKGNMFLPEESARSFEKVLAQLDQSITELRRVSHNMMPEALIKYGLKEALENYCENLDASGNVRVQLQTYGMEERMEQSTEIVIYRIVQELLNNVLKHAGADFVLVQLVREGERFSLTVEDNGKGFDSSLVKGGSGIANIKARIDYLNGSMDITSKPGEGTSVYLEGQCG